MKMPRTRHAELKRQYKDLWYQYEGLRWRWEILTAGKDFDPDEFDVEIVHKSIRPKMPKGDLPAGSLWGALRWPR